MAIRLFIFFLCLLVNISCDFNNDGNQLLGKWRLVSIESEINGIESYDEVLSGESDIFLELKEDSTYILCELGEVEYGRWIIKDDTLLGTIPNEYYSDTTDYVWMNISSNNDSTIILRHTVATDYGVVDEISIYKRAL